MSVTEMSVIEMSVIEMFGVERKILAPIAGKEEQLQEDAGQNIFAYVQCAESTSERKVDARRRSKLWMNKFLLHRNSEIQNRCLLF